MRNPISEFHPLAVFLYFMTAVGITLLWNGPGFCWRPFSSPLVMPAHWKKEKIFYQGIDYYNFTPNEIRNELALISQETTLFQCQLRTISG